MANDDDAVSVGCLPKRAWLAGAIKSIPFGEFKPRWFPLAAVIAMNESFAAVPGVEKSMNGVLEFIITPFSDTVVLLLLLKPHFVSLENVLWPPMV